MRMMLLSVVTLVWSLMSFLFITISTDLSRSACGRDRTTIHL